MLVLCGISALDLFNIEQIGTGIKKAAPKDGFLITGSTD